MAISLPIVSTYNNRGVQSAIGSFRKLGGAVAGVATASVAAIAGIGTAAVRMSNEFEQSFAKIRGLVGVSTSEVAKLSEAAAKLGPAFGKPAQEAADALFFITSAGLRGADAIQVLEASLKASAAGLGDVNQIANAATAAVNTYGTEVLTGAEAVDAFTEAVRLGQFAPEELAGAIGRVVPIANELDVSLQETLGLIASLTRGGLSASEAVTGIRGAMQAVLKPTGEAADMLEKYGLSTDEVRSLIEEDGLLATFNTLRDAFGENEEDFTRVIGSIEGLNAVLALTGENGETATDIVRQMSDDIGVLDDAFGAVEETAGFKFDRAMQTARAALLPVGDQILQVGATLIDGLMPTIEMLGPLFEETFAQLQEPLLMLAEMLPGIIEAFMPLLPIIGQIAAVFAELVVALLPVFVALAEALIPIVAMLVEAFQAFIVPLVEMLAPILTKIIELFTPLIEAILPILFILLDTLLDPLMRLIEALIPFYEVILPLLAEVVETIVVPALSMFAEWLEVWLPAALKFAEDVGLFPFLTAFEVFGASIKNGANGIQVTVATMINNMIAALERGVQGAIKAAKKIGIALRIVPGMQALAVAIARIPDVSEGDFGRVPVPERIYEFPEVDVQGISDAGRRFVDQLRQEQSEAFLNPIEQFMGSRQQPLPGGWRFEPIQPQTFGGDLPAPTQRGVQTIPGLANGGIVRAQPGGVLVNIGEGMYDEAVVPLRSGMNMGATYNITVNGGMMSDPVRVGEEVVNAIKRYERVSGPVFASA